MPIVWELWYLTTLREQRSIIVISSNDCWPITLVDTMN